MRTNVLGEEYVVEQHKLDDDILLETKDGYCDCTIKKIVVCVLKAEHGSEIDVSVEEKRILRHELVHAFLHESGLDASSGWAADETVVDWIAIQFPKLLKVFQECECL